MLDEPGADPAVVRAAADGDGHLGLVAGAPGVVLGETGHLTVTLGQQGMVARARRGTGPVGGPCGGQQAQGEETETQVLRRHLLMDSPQWAMVGRGHATDAHGGAVREKGVDHGAVEHVIRHHKAPSSLSMVGLRRPVSVRGDQSSATSAVRSSSRLV
ncbi:hypothetical protein ACFOZ0_01520 [Streptomyces yaanensis]|uniref:Uncharacterized protein n=1 Tax=Streptomyces yaanensis TaxID=1142239 RepID=A0ABV7S6Y1_9ACTN|nr:hypothetical protein [Streptomyces sp. CGMCC 4.7035]WNB99584.1 hypothetical protein Q2K21_16745 [Streptomyces sp. CGMCC 4.7035]